jgi:hypothetical protein
VGFKRFSFLKGTFSLSPYTAALEENEQYQPDISGSIPGH